MCMVDCISCDVLHLQTVYQCNLKCVFVTARVQGLYILFYLSSLTDVCNVLSYILVDTACLRNKQLKDKTSNIG